jgi:tetratricopeptide (TPR) repeat protein
LALNKRKVLETARKHAQKGAKAKALKEYNVLLKADPRDAKLLLEVGDAYRRWGQSEEAIAQYGKVAQQYQHDGFDARAVAVFKQILNLDPKQYSAFVSLSELYQRMGLDSEAISALQTAADGYHKEGRKTEALDLLRQTAALDPTNTTSRLKVADLLRREGMDDEALSEYKAVAEELENQQDRDQLVNVQERILEIKPDEVSALCALVRNLMSSGNLDRAEPFAVRALDVAAEPAQYELLIELYAQGGNDAKLANATRGLAKLYRDRGDEEKAKELMQRLPAEDMNSDSRLAVDTSEVDEPELDDEELLDEEPFLALTDEVESESDSQVDEIELDGVEPDALPEGDPDQLLAEANVYLRYGKRDQAISSLRGIITQDPNHRAALEKLGEAYADNGQTAEAVEAWKKAAVQVREAGDAEALAVLKDRLAALDPAAAEQIGSVDLKAQKAPEADLDVEVDLDLDRAINEVAAGESHSALDIDPEGDDFEIEIEVEFDDESMDDVSETETASSDESEQEISQTAPVLADDDDESIDLGLDLDLDVDVEDLTSPPAGTSADQSRTTAAKITEELDEAEFYLAQEMFDEAEATIERILKIVPDHPSAMLRMGEVEAGRAKAPAAGGQAELADDEIHDSDDDDTLTSANSTSSLVPPVEALDDVSSDADETQPAGDVALGEGDPEESFDLREALSDVLTDDQELSASDSSSGVLSTVEDGFVSIFSDFKKGVSETLDDGDFETRYDLGIAYREMELFDDAIDEFRICLDSPTRRFDSLYLMGICARELSRFEDAVNYFEQALALPELPSEGLASVYFDLSFAQEGAGEIERACASVQKVLEHQEDFPGASERLAALEAGGASSPVLGKPGEGFESFDELFHEDDDDEGGDVAMVEAIPAETLESFDDVIEEAEAILEAEEIVPEPESDGKTKSKSSKKTGRKKISFI